MNRMVAFGLLLMIAAIHLGNTPLGLASGGARAPELLLPPVIFSDHDFSLSDWTVTAQVTPGAAYTVTQHLDGGFGGGAFRFMAHILPPVAGSDLASVQVTHIYTPESYDPAVEGPITAIDYEEFGIILSFPFPEVFSTTQPVILQAGRVYRSPQFIRFIAQNSTHNWEFEELVGLQPADFVAEDGSGEHPDFSANGASLQFGFTRSNSRGSTQPPVPPGEDMIIEQGVDGWRITIHRDSLPPEAVDDVFVLDGDETSLPLLAFLHVVDNDGGDNVELSAVTQPLHGTTGIFSSSTVIFTLEDAVTADTFDYTISNGILTSSAQVQVLIDCACTVSCLSSLEPPETFTKAPQADAIDLPLLYRLRDTIMKPTRDGQRYVDMYYRSNPEILLKILADEALRLEAVAVVELWQDNLRSLISGDGSALVTQAQVDAVESFLAHLSAAASPELQQVIASELQRLGPLDDYAGLPVQEAKIRAIGQPVIYLPLVSSVAASGGDL